MADILLEVEALSNTVRVEEMLESCCPEFIHASLPQAKECGCFDEAIEAIKDRTLLPFKAFLPMLASHKDEFGHDAVNLIGRDIARMNAACYPDLYGDWVYREEYMREV